MSAKRAILPNGDVWCCRCKQFKVREAFGSNASRHDGIQTFCRKCVSDFYRTPEHLAQSRARNRKYRQRDPRKPMLCSARKRAKLAGIPFDLQLNDLVMPELCPLLGVPLQQGTQAHHDCAPSLDRIDPALGYVKGNVWIVSRRANTIKNNASLEELELLVGNLRRRVLG